MKKAIFIFILTCIISCTSKKPTTVQLVGKHTFELLQNMETISQEEFNKYFISLEELREFVKDTVVAETFRNAIMKVSPETHNTRLELSYQMIKETGETYAIDWNAIEFKEYMYQTKLHEGFDFHNGYVVFTHNKKEYVANIISLMYDGKQRLFNFSNFEPVQKP